MDAAYFSRLFAYNDWANTRFIEVLKNALNSGITIPENALELLSHNLGAQEIWLCRIQNIPGGKELFTPKSLPEIEALNQSSTQKWLNIIEKHKNELFDFKVNYKNLEGQSFQNSFAEICTHVSNHGTYHRGQIARALKAAGIQPPSSDFIVFSRN
jgi:uncharacterized damage-inducible protein DinB